MASEETLGLKPKNIKTTKLLAQNELHLKMPQSCSFKMIENYHFVARTSCRKNFYSRWNTAIIKKQKP